MDKVALDYFSVLLSPKTQEKIYDFLRAYNGHQQDMIESFYASINKEIAAKKVEYENMMKNLSSGIIPKAIMQDMMQRMENLQKEIETLRRENQRLNKVIDRMADLLADVR